MGTSIPIRNKEQLESFEDYYLREKKDPRNYLLIKMGLNTALRISDLLKLRWEDLYDFGRGSFREHLTLTEMKTGKTNTIVVNSALKDALGIYSSENRIEKGSFIFKSRKGTNSHISRQQAFRIVKEAAAYAGSGDHISCHSLRKTFGYFAWKTGAPVAVLMEIYNHSSYAITRRYLGIRQEEKDDIFINLRI